MIIKIGMIVVCQLLEPKIEKIDTFTKNQPKNEIILKKGTVTDILVEKDLKLIDNSYGIEEEKDILIVQLENKDLIKARSTSCRPFLKKEDFLKYKEELSEKEESSKEEKLEEELKEPVKSPIKKKSIDKKEDNKKDLLKKLEE